MSEENFIQDVGQEGWDAFWATTLDEGGQLPLWDIFSDTSTFFPSSSREERVLIAQRVFKRLLEDGWAELTAPSGRRLGSDEADDVIENGSWQLYPPPPEGDYEIVPTEKWRSWTKQRLISS
jgi:hypothetical protein